MRWGAATIAAIPVLAVALTAGAVEYVASAGTGSVRTSQLLRRAEQSLTREAFDAKVTYARRWGSGHMHVNLGVTMTATGAAQVEFLGMEAKSGITRWRKPASASHRMAMTVTGLQDRLQLVLDHDLTARNYHLRDVGEVQFAGRTARRYRLVPKLEGLGSLQLTIDNATGFPLERLEIDAAGKDRDAWRVGDLTFGAAPVRPSLLVVDTPKSALQARPSLQALHDLAGPIYLPSRLPRGFQLRQVNASAREGGHFAKLLYTDGVAHFVVLQWRGERGHWSGRTPTKGDGASQPRRSGDRGSRRGRGAWGAGGMGGRNAHGFGAKVEIDGSHIRVLGPLPKEMLRDIAERLVALPAR